MEEVTDPSVGVSIGEKPRALIFDLDGCVVDSSERAKTLIDHAARRRGDFEGYYRSLALEYSNTCAGDVPILRGIEIVDALRIGLGVDRTFGLTMRGEEAREPTLCWLIENLPFAFKSDDLVMSPGRWADENGNYYDPTAPNLSAVEYKRATALRLLGEYEIVAAVDDHPDICVMYRSIGIPALCVLYPGIDCLTPNGDRSLIAPSLGT